jgi:hypothetical protein
MHAGHIGFNYSVQLCDERANGFGTLSSNFFLVISEMGGASMKTSIIHREQCHAIVRGKNCRWRATAGLPS